MIFQLQQTNKHTYIQTYTEEGRYDYYHNAFISSQEHIMLVINFSQVGHQRQHPQYTDIRISHSCVFEEISFLCLFCRSLVTV